MQQAAVAEVPGGQKFREQYNAVKTLTVESAGTFVSNILSSFRDKKISAEEITHVALMISERFPSFRSKQVLTMLQAAYQSGHAAALNVIFMLREQSESEQKNNRLY